MFKKILLIIFVLFLRVDVVNALSVDKNELILAPGKNNVIGVYANVSEEVTSVKFSLVFSSYDVTATFTPVSTYTHSVPRSTSHLITFPVAQSGNIKLGDVAINVALEPKVSVGTINIHTATATTASGQIIQLNSQNITVNVSETTNVESQQVNTTYNLLSKIESDIVDINILDNVYSYDVEVSNDVTELDLKAIPKKESYKVDISSQKINDLKGNPIKINVVASDNKKQEYIINVKVIEKESNITSDQVVDEEDTTKDQFNIDKSKFNNASSYKIKWIGMILVLGFVLVMGILISKKKTK